MILGWNSSESFKKYIAVLSRLAGSLASCLTNLSRLAGLLASCLTNFSRLAGLQQAANKPAYFLAGSLAASLRLKKYP